jgi:hypothetical protein
MNSSLIHLTHAAAVQAERTSPRRARKSSS